MGQKLFKCSPKFYQNCAFDLISILYAFIKVLVKDKQNRSKKQRSLKRNILLAYSLKNQIICQKTLFTKRRRYLMEKLCLFCPNWKLSFLVVCSLNVDLIYLQQILEICNSDLFLFCRIKGKHSSITYISFITTIDRFLIIDWPLFLLTSLTTNVDSFWGISCKNTINN